MVEIREARSEDIPGILQLQQSAYPTLAKFSAWKADHLARHQQKFPAGQLVAVSDGLVVGFTASFIAQRKDVLRPHTFREVTGRGTFDSHDPQGDCLYGAEIMVHPSHRGKGIGRLMYAARFELVRRLGLRCFVAGGRLPGFSRAPPQVNVEDYVDSVVRGERVDRVLTPQLRTGLHPVGVLPEYLNDPKSRNFATLLVWKNPEFEGGDASA